MRRAFGEMKYRKLPQAPFGKGDFRRNKVLILIG